MSFVVYSVVPTSLLDLTSYTAPSGPESLYHQNAQRRPLYLLQSLSSYLLLRTFVVFTSCPTLFPAPRPVCQVPTTVLVTLPTSRTVPMPYHLTSRSLVLMTGSQRGYPEITKGRVFSVLESTCNTSYQFRFRTETASTVRINLGLFQAYDVNKLQRVQNEVKKKFQINNFFLSAYGTSKDVRLKTTNRRTPQ